MMIKYMSHFNGHFVESIPIYSETGVPKSDPFDWHIIVTSTYWVPPTRQPTPLPASAIRVSGREIHKNWWYSLRWSCLCCHSGTAIVEPAGQPHDCCGRVAGQTTPVQTVWVVNFYSTIKTKQGTVINAATMHRLAETSLASNAVVIKRL